MGFEGGPGWALWVAQDGLCGWPRMGFVGGPGWALNQVVYSFIFGWWKAGNRGVLNLASRMLEFGCWNLAAKSDSQPSPALATHLYDK